MGRKPKNQQGIPKDIPVSHASGLAAAMFREWVSDGTSLRVLGEKHGLNVNSMRDIHRKYKWATLRREFLRRTYAAALEEITTMAVGVVKLLNDDFHKVASEVKAQNRQLTTDERRHFTSLLDRFLKEKRLEDGMPTDLPTGQIQVEIILPAGVQSYGIIPPPANMGVTTVHKKPVDDDSVIDLDALEELDQ